LPGLIDAHSHLLLHPYDETTWDDQVLKESLAERICRATNHAKAGLLSGFTNNILIPAVFEKNAKLIGISVGSREQLEDMSEHLAQWKLHPVVDQVFPVDRVQDALMLMQAGGHFGKICVKF
jgi:NADPH:quinone reductase-like Zn-dependent oxidoreductase